MSSRGVRTHPLVVDAETVALQGLLLGTIGLCATVFFKSTVVFVAAAVLAVGATWLLGHVRRRRAADWVPSPPVRTMLPTYLAATALVIYAIVVGVVHTHAYIRSTNAFVVKERKAGQAIKAEGRRLTAADQQERQRDRALRLQLEHAKNPAAALKVLQELTANQRAESDTEKQFQAFLAASVAVALRPFPSTTELPRWFSRLQGVMATGAQVLAALVIALVFSRRRGQRDVDRVLRPAMWFALIGYSPR